METELNGFEIFWRAYPRHVAKQAAIKAYRKALKMATPETILRGAEGYAVKRRGEDVNFTKHPATWLNGGCWDDDAPAAPRPLDIKPGATFQTVFVAAETPQWRAWREHLGKTPPTNRNFGWFFPSEWPPGFSHEQR